MHFSLPESYADYTTRKDVRTAVDHLLDSKTLEVPSDLDWNQLPDFHAAVLAAHQVRSEYASAIQRLWNECWQTVLGASDLALEACSISETQEWYGLSFDTASVWTNKIFARAYDMEAFKIGVGVSLDRHEARLKFWLEDENGADRSIDCLTQADWEAEAVVYGYWTNKELAPTSNGGLELDRLNSVAAQVGEGLIALAAESKR